MITKRLYSLLILLFVVIAPCAFAQGWPSPSDSPNTEVVCAVCAGALKTVGYSDPIVGFAGRYVDSQATGQCQQTFRTARAREFVVVPEKNRVYMMLGQAFAAYDLRTFFTRLESRETLLKSTAVAVYPPNIHQCAASRDANPEVFLEYDKFFYAENTGAWATSIIDGQDRLFGFDYDDRGNIYLGYSVFGWGIVSDDGRNDKSLMTSKYQYKEGSASDVSPYTPIVVKTAGGRYVMFITQTGAPKFDVYDVTDATAPSRMGNLKRTLNSGMNGWARNTAGDRIALVGESGDLSIFTPEGMITNSPLTTFSSAFYKTVTTDGTNFYAVSDSSGVGSDITILRPNGNIYSAQSFPVGAGPGGSYFSATVLRYGGGYLTLGGNSDHGFDIRVFRFDAGNGPTEVSLNRYIAQYYNAPPPTAPRPSYTNAQNAQVIQQNGKTYLMVAAGGLGDVYKFRGGDSVAVTRNGGTVGTPNPNAPIRTPNTTFYADKVSFLSAMSSGAQSTLTWDFGNSESGAANTQVAPAGTVVSHQYSGLTPATLGGPRVVTATSGAVNGSVTVTLTSPVPRFGIMSSTGVKLDRIITQPDSSASAPIVVGDSFFDASDGDVEGHYATFTVDGVARNVPPYASLPTDYIASAGSCSSASHTLNFDAHYGTRTGLTIAPPDFVRSIQGFVYKANPFVASIDSPQPGPSTITFTGSVRVTSDATIISASQGAALTYSWALVDAGNAVVLAGPAGSVGAGVGSWGVPKTAFTTRGIRARLSVTSPTPITGSCAGLNLETFSALTNPLSGPDPRVDGDCINGGPPCNFSVASLSNVNQIADGWSYSWSVTPASVVIGTTNGNTLSPTFTAPGSYTVSVTVTNAISTQTASKVVTVTTASSPCPQLTANSLFATFSGSGSGCTANSGSCKTNESITFDIYKMALSYDFECNPHSYSWNFGDNSLAGTTKTAAHTYTSGGVFTAVCTVTAGNQRQSFSVPVTILSAVVIQPPPPPPPPPTPTPGACGSLDAGHVFLGYTGPSCSSNTNESCRVGETFSFVVTANGYSLSCANHFVSWTFGDGSAGSGIQTSHAYSQPGNYNVVVSINNGAATLNLQKTVTITGTGTLPLPPTPTPSSGCGTMSNSNVYVTYTGATSQCTPVFGSCAGGENIGFQANAINPYKFDCSTHTYAWDFGDGATATGLSASHAFTRVGTFPVAVTISNGTQTFVARSSIVIKSGGSGATPITSYGFTFVPLTLGGQVIPRTYVFAASSVPVDGTVVWKWDFSDGQTATSTGLRIPGDATSGYVTVQHTFPDDKPHAVILTASGVSGSVTKTVTPPPPVSRHRSATH